MLHSNSRKCSLPQFCHRLLWNLALWFRIVSAGLGFFSSGEIVLWTSPGIVSTAQSWYPEWPQHIKFIIHQCVSVSCLASTFKAKASRHLVVVNAFALRGSDVHKGEFTRSLQDIEPLYRLIIWYVWSACKPSYGRDLSSHRLRESLSILRSSWTWRQRNLKVRWDEWSLICP